MEGVTAHTEGELDRGNSCPLAKPETTCPPNDMRPCIFDPLPISSIRLISIDPEPSDKRLHCKIHRFEKESCPPYIALSYVWGPSDETARINLDEHDETIGLNLCNALLQFRDWQSSCTFQKDLGGDGTLWIWADAICINQGDDVEKSHQISQMDEIYASAALVVCWLGLPEDENVKDLEELMEHTKNPRLMRNLFEGIGPRLSPLWCRIASRPWFKRIWIVQEFCNARVPLFAIGKWYCNGVAFLGLKEGLHYGSGDFTNMMNAAALAYELRVTREFYEADLAVWEAQRKFQRLLDYEAEYQAKQKGEAQHHDALMNEVVSSNVQKDSMPEEDMDTVTKAPASIKDVTSEASDASFPKVRAIVAETEANNLKSLASSIFRFFRLTKHRKYSVRHDRIYSGLGMCRHYDYRTLAPALYPDYQNAFEWTCKQYATFILNHEREISILGYGPFEEIEASGASKVPSWVPNFSYTSPMVERRTFSDLEPSFTFQKDSNVLSVQGLALGALVVSFDASDPNLDLQAIDACIHPKDPTEMVGQTEGIKWVVEDLISFFAEYYSPSRRADFVQHSPDISFHNRVQTLLSLSASGSPDFRMPAIRNRTSDHTHVLLCSNGTMLLSRHRRADELQPHDDVVAFKGFEHPVLLRQCDQGYRFLGGCEFITPCAERMLDPEYWSGKELQAFDLI